MSSCLNCLRGKESHSKRVIIIILNIQMNDPIDFRPLCSVSPRQESLSAPAAGLAALPWIIQSTAEAPLLPPLHVPPAPLGLSFPQSPAPPRPQHSEDLSRQIYFPGNPFALDTRGRVLGNCPSHQGRVQGECL